MLVAMGSGEEEAAARQPMILVVEDEILVRSPVAEFLRTVGYKVVEAANAAAAVAVLNTGTVIDLVFSDIDMPGPMDGVGLACWISVHHPGIHVILTSGIHHAAQGRGTKDLFLPKPFRLAEVALRIHSLLEDPLQEEA